MYNYKVPIAALLRVRMKHQVVLHIIHGLLRFAGRPLDPLDPLGPLARYTRTSTLYTPTANPPIQLSESSGETIITNHP